MVILLQSIPLLLLSSPATIVHTKRSLINLAYSGQSTTLSQFIYTDSANWTTLIHYHSHHFYLPFSAHFIITCHFPGVRPTSVNLSLLIQDFFIDFSELLTPFSDLTSSSYQNTCSKYIHLVSESTCAIAFLCFACLNILVLLHCSFKRTKQTLIQ